MYIPTYIIHAQGVLYVYSTCVYIHISHTHKQIHIQTHINKTYSLLLWLQSKGGDITNN